MCTGLERVLMRIIPKTLLMLICAASSNGAAHARPNIVLIFADDLGYCDSELYGCDAVPTPNIKRIADEGVLFTAGYVTSPVCSPSRAGLLTGRYQQRFGHEFLPSSDTFGLPVGESTLADALRSTGYTTGMVGKWHLGVREEFHPMRRGFDEYFGVIDWGSDYVDPYDEKTQRIARASEKAKPPSAEVRAAWERQGVSAVVRGTEPVNEDDYLTDALSRESVAYINKHKDEPFFLYVPYTAVHQPLQVTQKYYDRFPNIKDESTRIYAAMTSSLDDGIGTILDALEDNDLEGNTLVIFLSDNGAGVADYCSNEPLRLGKQTLFEGGVRVPFTMKWPAKIAAGTTYEHPVSSLDIFPTAMAATDSKPSSTPSGDGVDLMPFLDPSNSARPHDELFWRSGPNWAVRDGNWKLIYAGDQYWLYDLSTDIGEKVNVVAEHPEIVKKIKAKYDQWNSQMMDPLWPPIGVKSMPGFNVDGVEVEWPV